MNIRARIVKKGIQLVRDAATASSKAKPKPAQKPVPAKPAQKPAPKPVPEKPAATPRRKRVDAEEAKRAIWQAGYKGEMEGRAWMERALKKKTDFYDTYHKNKALKAQKKAERIGKAKEVARKTGKIAAGTAVGALGLDMMTMGEFSKALGRKEKPTKASPSTRRGGKPMKGTK